jgi:hypothetical protein
MKSLRLFWDFLFGVLLIGGAPISVLALTVVLADLYQATFHMVIPRGTSLILVVLSFVIAALAFAYAIRFRLRRRLLPKRALLGEVLLGLIGSFFVYLFYGVVTYSSIG